MSAPDPPLLLMEGIGKRFSGDWVLRDARLELRPGEVHVLAGENGAGKSTLIKILGGIHARDEGRMFIDGKAFDPHRPADATARGIAIIHQELSLCPNLSVLDNVFLGREVLRRGIVNRAAQLGRAEAVLAKLSIDLPLERRVEQLTLAQQQVAEIVKALLLDTKVLVMDEPTSSLKAPEAERLFATISQLRSSGAAVVYISHKMNEIYRLADRITVLRDGLTVGTEDAEKLPEEELVRWMVGRPLGEQYSRLPPPAGESALEVRGFTLKALARQERPAVEDIDLCVRQGEIVGLSGLEGSGVHELISGIFGRYGAPSRGTVTVAGQDLKGWHPRAAIQSGMALVTPDRKRDGLVLGMPVYQNMTLSALPQYSPWTVLRPQKEKAGAEKRAEELGIRYRTIDQPVRTLSGGNQQKVILGKWLENQPAVILLDDPTRGVDIGSKREVYALMDQWTREGMGLLFFSSELPELLALADRIVVLHRGRMAAVLRRSEATSEAVMKAAMGG